VKSNPFTLILNNLSKCYSDIFPNGANCIMPAFAYSISIRPFLSLTTSNALSISSKLDTSH
jgi:hypothetical protein